MTETEIMVIENKLYQMGGPFASWETTEFVDAVKKLLKGYKADKEFRGKCAECGNEIHILNGFVEVKP